MKHLTIIVPAQDRREDTPLSGPWQQIMGGLLMTCKIWLFFSKVYGQFKAVFVKGVFI